MRDRERYREQARAAARGARRGGLRVAGQRGDDVPVGRGAGGRDVGGASPTRLLEHGIVVAPGSYFGPTRRGLRPHRARRRRRRVRACGRDPGSALSLAERIDELWERRARGRAGRGGDRLLDRGEVARRRAARRRAGSSNEWLKQAILDYFRLRKVEPIEVGQFGYLDKIPLKRDYADARRARRAARRWRGTARSCREGVDDDAELREHRRLGRATDDDRHVGDGRLVRADRRGRAPGGRGRHRRRARAAAGAAR